MLTDEDVLAAEARFEEKQRTMPFAIKARFDALLRRVVIDLNAGWSISFAPERARRGRGTKQQIPLHPASKNARRGPRPAGMTNKRQWPAVVALLGLGEWGNLRDTSLS
jgi:hypothetical protein